MTRRDYELIARAIKAASAAPGYAVRNKFVACALADALHQDNPRNFDRALFLTNYGVNQP